MRSEQSFLVIQMMIKMLVFVVQIYIRYMNMPVPMRIRGKV